LFCCCSGMDWMAFLTKFCGWFEVVVRFIFEMISGDALQKTMFSSLKISKVNSTTSRHLKFHFVVQAWSKVWKSGSNGIHGVVVESMSPSSPSSFALYSRHLIKFAIKTLYR
jgi:hypothetical protein